MAEESEKSVGELRSEAVTALLKRIIKSTNSSGTEAAKIRDLAEAVRALDGA